MKTTKSLTKIDKYSIYSFLIISLIFVLFLLFKKDKYEILKEDFIENEVFFDDLILEVKKSKNQKYCNRTLEIKNLPLNIKKQLIKANIDDFFKVTITTNSEFNYYKIDFESEDNLHLIYSDEPNNLHYRNYHNENGLIETWGLDKNWEIWIDHDFI